MEITKEDTNLLENFLPPRLEDAGLEDCALAPDAIREAFLKAANAVSSRAASILSNENDDCVDDPIPDVGESSDTLVGISPASDPLNGPCTGEKCGGGLPEVISDEVGAGVTEAEEKVNDLVGGKEVKEQEREKACVDGLQGLEIGKNNGYGKKKLNNDEKEVEEEDDDERPTLVEGYV